MFSWLRETVSLTYIFIENIGVDKHGWSFFFLSMVSNKNENKVAQDVFYIGETLVSGKNNQTWDKCEV